MGVQYQVFITPRLSDSVYGTEVDASDLVKSAGVGEIVRSIDSADYDYGTYAFDEVVLTCDNSDGKFNEASDSRSLFPYVRDLAKVRVVFNQGSSTPTTFYGIISDEATELDVQNDEIALHVLGRDAIFNKATIQAGTVGDGVSAKDAILAIINSVEVRALLTVDVANLNPPINPTVGIGSYFDDKNKRDALDELLFATNSVLLIDDAGSIIVRDRTENLDTPVLYLYGKYDRRGRCNISQISDWNTGLHRVFNVIKITGGSPPASISGETVVTEAPTVTVEDATSRSIYGARPKDLKFDWITDEAVLLTIGNAHLVQWRYAKPEVTLRLPTETAYQHELFDRACVNYPLQVKAVGKFLPQIGVTKIGDVNSPLPYRSGSLSIDPSLSFKIVEISEDPKSFFTSVKLRQTGTTLNDGVFGWLETESGSVIQTESGQDIIA